MSHFTTLRTRITDPEALKKALADVGFARVDCYEQPQPLYGFQGDRRAEMAEIVIRRQHIGWASNDIGFKLQEDGTFNAIISEWDRKQYSAEWLDRVSQRYAYHVACERLAAQGFDLVSEETAPGGQIHLVLRRMA